MIDNTAVKMKQDAGAYIAVISSSIWEKLGRPTLDATGQMQKAVTAKLQDMFIRGVLESAQPRGVINASPVVRQREIHGDLRLCADYTVHLKGAAIEED